MNKIWSQALARIIHSLPQCVMKLSLCIYRIDPRGLITMINKISKVINNSSKQPNAIRLTVLFLIILSDFIGFVFWDLKWPFIYFYQYLDKASCDSLVYYSEFQTISMPLLWHQLIQPAHEALRAPGLLLADGALTVGRGKNFWRVYLVFFLRKRL